MALTVKKYNQERKVYYDSNSTKDELTQNLGPIEELIEKYGLEGKNIDDTLNNLEKAIVIGSAGLKRIERAINYRVYYISANKTRRAHLIGFASPDYGKDAVIIEKKGTTVVLPYKDIFISRREARHEKKGIQKYRIDKKLYDKIFKGTKYKKTYLMETKKGSDEFKIYTKVLRAYWRLRDSHVYTLTELKEKFDFDLEALYKDKREKFLKKQRKCKSIV